MVINEGNPIPLPEDIEIDDIERVNLTKHYSKHSQISQSTKASHFT